MKRGASFSFLCALLLAAGCATAPPPGGEPGKTPPEEFSPPEEVPAFPESPPESAPGPKPRTVELEHGHAFARVDGVRVFLDAPAKTDWKSKKTAAAWIDRKSTLGPLLDARTEPLVRGRPFRICLDPGHGGSDPGAASSDGKTVESVLALDVARRVRELLEADGFDVTLTRRDAATEQTLEERAAKAERWKADAFVSVHFNTNPKTSAASGLETYVFPARGMESTSYSGRRPSPEAKQAWRGSANNEGSVQLGFCLQRRLLAATELPDRGLRRARFVVLREAAVPAALVECGFLSSPRDLAYVRTEEGRDALARGLYEGICDFAFGTMAPGLPPRKPPAPGAAPPKPAAPEPPVSIVRGDRPPSYAPPVPEDSADPARRAAREAALRAAGLPSASGNKENEP